MMTVIKEGVDLRGLQPQLAVAYAIAWWVYAKNGQVPCVITSASDSAHGPNSLHPSGNALDLRTRGIAPGVLLDIHQQLTDALGAQFDVVLEDDHLHMEFDPKGTLKETTA